MEVLSSGLVTAELNTKSVHLMREQMSNDSTDTNTDSASEMGVKSGSAASPSPESVPVVRTEEEKTFSAELEQKFLHEAESKQQNDKEVQFKVQDLLKNRELSTRAWQEMASAGQDMEQKSVVGGLNLASLPSTPGYGASSRPYTPAEVDVQPLPRTVGKCMAELLRDRTNLDAILVDADAEYKINCDISRLLISRLKAGRQALEAQHTFMMNIAEGERMAANYLKDSVTLSLHCDGDPGAVHTLAAAAASLPDVLADRRRSAFNRLTAVARDIAALIHKFRSAGDALTRACGALDWMAEKKRSLVARAFNAHETACLEADKVDEFKKKGGGPAVTDIDPWGTLAVLAASEHALLVSQQTQRGVVTDANEQVERLERSRMASWQRMVAALLQTYGTGGESSNSGDLKIDAITQLADLKDCVEWNSLMGPMARAVEEGRTTAQNLQVRSLETTKTLVQDLFSSAEILRQGSMQRWNASVGNWVPYHGVLTRRGVVHLCRSPTVEGCVPVESIPLRHMDFDGVAATVFSMMRQQSVFAWFAGRPTKIVLQVDNVSTCSKWIVDMKEQMAEWSGREHVKGPVERMRSRDIL